MSDETQCQSHFNLEEFTSSYKECVIYYHMLRLHGSIYVWVGTENGEQRCIVAALSTRLEDDASRPVSTLVSGPTQDVSAACATRLHLKLGYPILLSLNIIDDDQQLLEHIERIIIERLS